MTSDMVSLASLVKEVEERKEGVLGGREQRSLVVVVSGVFHRYVVLVLNSRGVTGIIVRST